MKASGIRMNRFGWMIAAALLVSFSVLSPFDDVVSALKSGNATEVSRFFDSMVEISLPANSNSYSKAQAEIILREFFSRNPVKSFEIIHKGSSGEGSSFGIGNLVTDHGTFRTTFFFRQKGDKFVLQELRFESE